jgi:peptide/nickel transport system permease protein
MSAQPSVRRFALQRTLHALPLLFGIVAFTFALIHLAPGDPLRALSGDLPANEEYVRQVRERYGLDRPVGEQFITYVTRVFQGDLGYSLSKRQPVSDVLLSRMGPTALLVGAAIIGAAILGIAAGVASASRPYSRLDNALSIIGVLGYSIPVFWFAQILLIVFAVNLHWLPVQGISDIRGPTDPVGRVLDVGAHLILPAVALSMRFLIVNMRITRASMLDVMGREYIMTARAKGQSPSGVLVHHALPNAMLPVVTVIGLDLGILFTGSALVEIIFAWPGVGSLMFESIGTRDYPVLMGIFLVVAVTAIVANLITDILYAFLDPRIRY